MAKQGPTNLPAFFNVDADFEAFVTGIHNALIALGFVQTGDTGQINPAAVLKPAASNAAQGYEIWRFNDALQATVPIFVKLEYGSGSPAATAPGLWITVGSGSNGAGALTGQLSTRTAISPSGSKAAGVTLPSFFSDSGDGSSLIVASNVDTASSNFGMLFAIMRPKDNNGNATNEGVVVFETNTNSGQLYIQFIPASGAVPAQITNQLPAISPWFFNRATSGANADACPMMLPLLGAWRYLKLLLTGTGDFGAGGTFQCNIFGAAHTFLALNNNCGNINAGGNGNGGNPGFAIPWE